MKYGLMFAGVLVGIFCANYLINVLPVLFGSLWEIP